MGSRNNRYFEDSRRGEYQMLIDEPSDNEEPSEEQTHPLVVRRSVYTKMEVIICRTLKQPMKPSKILGHDSIVRPVVDEIKKIAGTAAIYTALRMTEMYKEKAMNDYSLNQRLFRSRAEFCETLARLLLFTYKDVGNLFVQGLSWQYVDEPPPSAASSRATLSLPFSSSSSPQSSPSSNGTYTSPVASPSPNAFGSAGYLGLNDSTITDAESIGYLPRNALSVAVHCHAGLFMSEPLVVKCR
ncbi:hypothetical protein BKA69DRAFT_162481 [Paraphysoderma sedebokerense]|nr:hypothetical protein BKA69DRAFT_162481 [Paraphysoderma sedebokerense]